MSISVDALKKVETVIGKKEMNKFKENTKGVRSDTMLVKKIGVTRSPSEYTRYLSLFGSDKFLQLAEILPEIFTTAYCGKKRSGLLEKIMAEVENRK